MDYKIKKWIVSFLRFKKAFIHYPYRKLNVVEILIFWINERLTRSQFLILSGVLVGLTAGLAGVILKVIVHYIQAFINNEVPFKERLFVFAVFPVIGITLTALIVKYLFHSDDEKELSFVLKDISQNDSKIKPHKMYSQIVQSAVTVGFGGSAGLETPIAVTGSAIGSNYAQRYRLGFKERTLLLASGAAAGIAAAFDAPIAGVMFAFEIILTGLVFTDFIPLVIAAICGSLLSTVILNEDVLFNLHAREAFDYSNTLYFIVLGVISGLYARYFLIVGQKTGIFFNRYKHRILTKALVGGTMLSLLCVVFPPLFGEGYLNIRILHQGNLNFLLHESLFRYFGDSQLIVLCFLTFCTFLKAFATSITLSSGGNGGNFAPSLVAGGLLGYLFGFILEMAGMEHVPVSNLMLVGMAGVMSGALYAPLTAIFLIAETSSGYDLFIPLMIVSVIAYAINRYFSSINPSYKELAEKGEIFTTRQDQNLLAHIHILDCLNPTTLVVSTQDSLDEVLNKYRNSNENTIAVVDDHNKFWGILNRERLRPFLLGQKSTHEVTVSHLTTNPSFTISPKDSVINVVKMFEQADVWHLPVLSEDRDFLGLVSRARILTHYRSLLKNYSE